MQSVIDKIKALPNAAKPDGMWSTLRRRKEKQYGKTQWKKNPIKLIPKPADALAFKQLPIPLRDKLVNTAPIKSFDPRKLVTNQPMVSQADLVHFADHGTDPEPVIILKSTDGLYVHNGNHRSALAMMRGRKVKARYIDLSQVPQLKGKKPVPQERAVDAGGPGSGRHAGSGSQQEEYSRLMAPRLAEEEVEKRQANADFQSDKIKSTKDLDEVYKRIDEKTRQVAETMRQQVLGSGVAAYKMRDNDGVFTSEEALDKEARRGAQLVHTASLRDSAGSGATGSALGQRAALLASSMVNFDGLVGEVFDAGGPGSGRHKEIPGEGWVTKSGKFIPVSHEGAHGEHSDVAKANGLGNTVDKAFANGHVRVAELLDNEWGLNIGKTTSEACERLQDVVDRLPDTTRGIYIDYSSRGGNKSASAHFTGGSAKVKALDWIAKGAKTSVFYSAAGGHPFDGEKAEDGYGIGNCKECGKPWKNKAHWRIAAGGPGSGRHKEVGGAGWVTKGGKFIPLESKDGHLYSHVDVANKNGLGKTYEEAWKNGHVRVSTAMGNKLLALESGKNTAEARERLIDIVQRLPDSKIITIEHSQGMPGVRSVYRTFYDPSSKEEASDWLDKGAKTSVFYSAAGGHPFDGEKAEDGYGIGNCKECGKPWKNKAHWRIAAGGPGSGRHPGGGVVRQGKIVKWGLTPKNEKIFAKYGLKVKLVDAKQLQPSEHSSWRQALFTFMKSPRDRKYLDGLTDGMRAGKLVYPLEVEKNKSGGYDVMDGHNRYVAATEAGETKIAVFESPVEAKQDKFMEENLDLQKVVKASAISAGGPGSGWTTENGHVSNLTPQDKGQKLQKMGFFHTDQSVYGGNKEVWQHKDTGTQVHVSKYNAPNQPNLRKFEVYKSNGDKIFNGHQFSKAVEKMQNIPMQKSEMKPATPVEKESNPLANFKLKPDAPEPSKSTPGVTPQLKQDALRKAGFTPSATNGTNMDEWKHPSGVTVEVTNKAGGISSWTLYDKDGDNKASGYSGYSTDSMNVALGKLVGNDKPEEKIPSNATKTTEPSIPASGKNAVLQDAGFHVAYTSKLVETGQPTDVWVHSTTQDAVHVIATDPTHSSWKYIPANGSPSTGKMADDLKQAIATGGKPAAADKPSSTKTSTPSEPKTPDMIPVTKEWWDKLDKAASDNWVKGGSSVMTNYPSADKPNDYHANATGWYGKVAAAMGVPISSLKYAGDRIGNLQSGTTANSGNVIGKWAQSVVNNVGQAGSVHPGTAIEYAHTQQWLKEQGGGDPVKGMPNGGTMARGYQGTGEMNKNAGFKVSQAQITNLNNQVHLQPKGFEISMPVNGVEGFSIKPGWGQFSNEKGAVVQLHNVDPKNVLSGWGMGGMVDSYDTEKEWLLMFKDSSMPIRTFAGGKNATVKVTGAGEAVGAAVNDRLFWLGMVQLKKDGWNWTVKGKKITITPPGWFTDRKNIVLDPDQMAAASVSSSSEEAAVDNLSPGSIAREMIRSKALGVSSAAYKLAGVTSFQGLPISIENKKGDVRSGVDADGTKWSVVMPESYGYIKGTKGADGSPIDCFVGPLKDAKFAYICHINKTDGSGFDEDKTFIGFASATRAKAALLAAYSGVDVFHSMTILPMHEFIKRVLSTKNSKRPHKIHAEVAA